MFRLLAIALLALALTPGVRPVDAAQDMRIDPRAVNIAPEDLPKAFSETTRLFSVNRYGPLYFGDYGSRIWLATTPTSYSAAMTIACSLNSATSLKTA